MITRTNNSEEQQTNHNLANKYLVVLQQRATNKKTKGQIFNYSVEFDIDNTEHRIIYVHFWRVDPESASPLHVNEMSDSRQCRPAQLNRAMNLNDITLE